MKKIILILFVGVIANHASAQTAVDSLKSEILALQADVESIHLNLETSKSKFQRGILVATIGYTVTIAGGLMLGRENDEVGQVLLIAGGVTGVTGTFLLVDSFKFLGRTRRKDSNSKK